MTGRVTFMGAGPGDPDLITVRGAKVLREADYVLYDALVDDRLLEYVGGTAIFAGKRSGRHSMPQAELNRLIVRLAGAGHHVVRLKGGDPTVFGRGAEEALACREHGIPFDFVPGVSSCVAAPLHAGIPVTHRGVADSFTVVTAHRRNDDLEFSIPPYNPRTTVVLLMGIGTIDAWRRTLARRGYPDDLPLAFVERGSWAGQRVITSTVGTAVADAREAEISTPAIVVIGYVVELRSALQWFSAEAQRPETGPSDEPKTSLAASAYEALEPAE